MTLPDTRQAACYGIPTDMFFPEADDASPMWAALRVCRNCPIVGACRDYAVEHGETGIWGATTDRQRVKLRRERGITLRPAESDTRRRVRELTAQGHSLAEIADITKTHPRTVQRYWAGLRQVAA